MPSSADTAKEAFIYGYPMVDLYNILHNYAGDPASPEYKAPLNHISNTRRVATPEDKAIVAPNCDTPYSYAWLDLRAEPVVLTIPPFEPQRYVSLMLSDLYTYIVGYVTPRTNGAAGGSFLVAGPDWLGETPPGIKRVFHSPTQLALAFYRTQLFGPDDLQAVLQIQEQYRGRPFDGSRAYRIKFTPDTMPPVRAFWSITVYDAAMLLYANPLQRYVINAPMVDHLVKDPDGGFTLCVQHESPGIDKETNWLPVPQGNFNLTFRAYQPEAAILEFTYSAPPVVMIG